MKVMVIVKANAKSEAGEMPGQELLTAMMQYNEELVNAGVMQAGDGLHPTSKGVRLRFEGSNPPEVSHGPFGGAVEELIAGYWLWNVKSMDEAIEWARRCPNPSDGATGILELRPIFEMEDFGDAATPELREQEARLREQTAANR